MKDSSKEVQDLYFAKAQLKFEPKGNPQPPVPQINLAFKSHQL